MKPENTSPDLIKKPRRNSSDVAKDRPGLDRQWLMKELLHFKDWGVSSAERKMSLFGTKLHLSLPHRFGAAVPQARLTL